MPEKDLLSKSDLAPENNLASQPTLRIELLRFVTQLEVQGTVARSIASHTAQRLSSRYVLTLPHGNSREITVDRDVATMRTITLVMPPMEKIAVTSPSNTQRA